jgi:hypothetical protein
MQLRLDQVLPDRAGALVDLIADDGPLLFVDDRPQLPVSAVVRVELNFQLFDQSPKVLVLDRQVLEQIPDCILDRVVRHKRILARAALAAGPLAS